MITPMVRTAAGQLVAATETALAQHEADSANEALEAIQRCAATKKAIHQRNMRDALNRIIQAPDDYIVVASQPLQSFPCLDALDAAVPLVARNDSDADAPRRRSSLGWAFARESSIATVIVRKTCQVALDSRAAMLVAQRLLRTPTPAAADAHGSADGSCAHHRSRREPPRQQALTAPQRVRAPSQARPVSVGAVLLEPLPRRRH